MTIAATIAGGEALLAFFASRSAALDQRLGIAFAGIAEALYARALGNLSGAVLNVGSGRLRAALARRADSRSASIGVNRAAAPYAAALEFGAAIPAQLIAAKRAKALAFVVGGSQVFAKHAMRPAFALPPHSFLGSALAELAPTLLATLDAAVAEAMTP